MDNRTIPIVLAVIKNEQNQVLISRRNDPALIGGHDKWELVGGRIEWDETVEEAMVREVKESGLDVEIVRLLPKIYTNVWSYQNDSEFKALLISYECKVSGGSLHTTSFDERVSELKFIELSDLSKYDFLPHSEDIIKLAYA